MCMVHTKGIELHSGRTILLQDEVLTH
jgi:hypothetical protein